MSRCKRGTAWASGFRAGVLYGFYEGHYKGSAGFSEFSVWGCSVGLRTFGVSGFSDSSPWLRVRTGGLPCLASLKAARGMDGF